MVTITEDLSIYWQSVPIHASQAHRHELLHRPCLSRIFQLRPLLDLPERVSDKNTVDEGCLSRPDRSVGAAGRSAAKNCFTEPFELIALRFPGSTCKIRGSSTKLEPVNDLIVHV
jgi:hypothetical protein